MVRSFVGMVSKGKRFGLTGTPLAQLVVTNDATTLDERQRQ
jgi:hypothetical protein